MDTARHLELLEALFRQHGLSVARVAQLSERADADLVLWPYDVRTDQASRNAPSPHRDGTGRRSPVVHRQHTHLLVLPRDVARFDQARRLILDQPVLAGGEASAQAQLESLPLADLAALFQAAGVPMRLALTVALG